MKQITEYCLFSSAVNGTVSRGKNTVMIKLNKMKCCIIGHFFFPALPCLLALCFENVAFLTRRDIFACLMNCSWPSLSTFRPRMLKHFNEGLKEMRASDTLSSVFFKHGAVSKSTYLWSLKMAATPYKGDKRGSVFFRFIFCQVWQNICICEPLHSNRRAGETQKYDCETTDVVSEETEPAELS